MEDIKKNLEEEILEAEELNSKDENSNNSEEAKEDKVEKSDLEVLQDEKDKLIMELNDWKSAYQRKNAEFQNFTKRKDKELEEFRKFASEKVILKVLEAIDNLERAVSASSGTKDFESLVKGVEMTLNQMQNIMGTEGVEAIEAVGKEFDPYLHQAIMTENIEEVEDNYITVEVQKGYKMYEKVIRPSMVKVCKK